MTEKKIVVITSYPERGSIHGQKTVGLASYTKNTLLAIKNLDKSLQIVVLAEILKKPEEYQEKGILIKRIWRKGKIIDIFKILWQVRESKTNVILVPFEAYMFGSLPKIVPFLALFFLFKLSGKKIYFILHQIIEDFEKFEENKFKAKLLNLTKNVFYRLLLLISAKAIVFEEKFKRILGDNEKIVTIPHAVEKQKLMNKRLARKKLGLSQKNFYVLYFGFLSPYKGADFLVKAWKNVRGAKLILAGGGNPNHMADKKYARFVKNLISEAKKMGVLTPGFVAEEEIPIYFSAADLFILPYKVFISSSGPLSFAFGYDKPTLLSQPLKGYSESKDMKQALNEAHLEVNDLLFTLSKKDLAKKIFWARKNENRKRLAQFSRLMKEKRDWSKISKKYLEIL